MPSSAMLHCVALVEASPVFPLIQPNAMSTFDTKVNNSFLRKLN
jgi:hypothetical protein